MPRLPPALLRRAAALSPHLATLLPACRTIESARAELRWIREHVVSTSGSTSSSISSSRSRSRSSSGSNVRLRRERERERRREKEIERETKIAHLVARRGAGEPLQYVLGSQPFAGLDVRCAPGVLIPRPETEAWVGLLGEFLFGMGVGDVRFCGSGNGDDALRVLDLCSGTGCIGLALFARGMECEKRKMGRGKRETGSLLPPPPPPPPVRVCGLDIEPRAIRLARRNALHNFSQGGTTTAAAAAATATAVKEGSIPVTFRKADIFTNEWMQNLFPNNDSGNDPRTRPRKIDVLVSNPPYISQRGFAVDTGRSVRNYEPKLALVPPPPPSPSPSSFPFSSSPQENASPTIAAPEDIFYARLLSIADTLRPRIAVFEVGDMKQAMRVVEMVVAWSRVGDGLHGLNGIENGEVAEDGNERRGGNKGDDRRIAPRWDVVEIWRDWPDCRPSDDEEDVVVVSGREIPVRGSGHGRVVFLVEGEMIRSRFTNRGFRHEVYVDR